jgi:hypothetical protein
VIVVSLGFLTGVNIIGVRSAARTGVVLVIGKMLPLLLFVAIGAFYIDLQLAFSASAQTRMTCSAWAKPRSCCTPTPASRTSRPPPARVPQSARRYSVRADHHDHHRHRVSSAVQVVAQGTLAALSSSAPHAAADAAAGFGGEALALILTIGAAISILGTNSNTMMMGPLLFALARDGYGPKILAQVRIRASIPRPRVDPVPGPDRARPGAVRLVRAAGPAVDDHAAVRLHRYRRSGTGTGQALRRPPGALKLPGGPLIPVLALLLCLALFCQWLTIIAAALVAFAIGAVILQLAAQGCRRRVIGSAGAMPGGLIWRSRCRPRR